MSNTNSDPEFDKESENHAFHITRKLFLYTIGGTVLWGAAVSIFILF